MSQNNNCQNDFLIKLLDLQQDGKEAISNPANWIQNKPLLEVETKTDEIICELGDAILLNGNNTGVARWHFFIGSPGNGKSAAIGKLCRNLNKFKNCNVTDENRVPIEKLSKDSVPYSLNVYEKGNLFASAMIVQDASVVRNPFAPDVDPARELVDVLEETWEKGISLIICTNRGVMEKAFRERYQDDVFRDKAWFKIIRCLAENCEEGMKGYLEGEIPFNNRRSVFPSLKVSFSYLDNQSLLLGDDTFDRLVQSATCSGNWKACENCEQRSLCPFLANRNWLLNEDSRANFLRILLRAEVLSGQIIVFREALAFMSLLLAGCPRDYGEKNPCEWVLEKIETNDIFALAMRRIYMIVFASYSVYGLEMNEVQRGKQQQALSLLANLGKEEPGIFDQLEHVIKTSAPSTDVGVSRLTGPQGLLAEIDPLRDCLPWDFIEKWDGDLGVISSCENLLFTGIEKHCAMTWKYLEELIESTPSHEVTTCYWAVRRWSSNFLMHFGGLLEGISCWGKELDEFIKVLETLVKDTAKRSDEETRLVHDLGDQLDSPIAEGANNFQTDRRIPLSQAVMLSGRWVTDNLRPKIDSIKKPENLSLSIKFREKENFSLGARTFMWLYKHLLDNLVPVCFPQQLLTGMTDTRIRAASKGEKAYAFSNDDVELRINNGEGGIFELSRFDGVVITDEKQQ